MPKRIQRKRTKGWRMPEGAVYVGRPTRWGNPFQVNAYGSAERCVELYKKYLDVRLSTSILDREALLRELRGKDLACWCPLDQPCHADVLLEIANEQEEAPADAE